MESLESADIIAASLLALLCVPVVYYELSSRRIPNFITYAGIAAGLLIAVIWRRDELFNYLGAFLFGFGLFYVFYLLGWIGGGDVKLMGMVGMLMGLGFLFSTLIYTTLAGGVIAFGVLVYRLLRRLPLRGATIPYGTAIVAGSYICLLERLW